LRSRTQIRPQIPEQSGAASVAQPLPSAGHVEISTRLFSCEIERAVQWTTWAGHLAMRIDVENGEHAVAVEGVQPKPWGTYGSETLF